MVPVCCPGFSIVVYFISLFSLDWFEISDPNHGKNYVHVNHRYIDAIPTDWFASGVASWVAESFFAGGDMTRVNIAIVHDDTFMFSCISVDSPRVTYSNVHDHVMGASKSDELPW